MSATTDPNEGGVRPRTLFELAGRMAVPARLEDAALVLIDYQNEYLDGPLRLADVEAAVKRASRLLAAARSVGARIVHVAHRGATGGLFDRAQHRGAFIDALAPREGEAVVEKTRPNGFSGTDLADHLGPAGAAIVVAGFMTHNCVSSTVRAALDLGLAITLVEDACATRDLPKRSGSVMPAATLHAATIAALADRHASVVDVEAMVTVSHG